ncbi:hypothetical protein, partial [Endozoicomonas sp. ONNA1]
PGELEKLEEELIQLEEAIADPSFYQGDQEVVQTTLARLETVNQDIEEKMERWEELENMS